MTKLTGRPRGRPRKHPLPEAVKPEADQTEREEAVTTETPNRTVTYERAYARLNEALAAEENARMGGGGPAAVEAATKETAAARAQMERVKEERKAAGDEEMVVLLAPNRLNPYVKDCNNLGFRYGRALASRSVANHYMDVLPGYSVEGE